MESFVLDPNQIRDISAELLDADGRLRIVPASVLQSTSAAERLLFGVRQGIYGLPTQELCTFLRERISGRCAIEIGAGHGELARALGIPATDNRQQEEPAVAAHYQSLGQPTIRYGEHVEKLDAAVALAKYRPEVVVASWVTHRFEASHPSRGGSVTGVDEAAIIAACQEYILIGNEHVHKHKPIWALAHEKISPPWLYSRAVNGSPDFIAIWPPS